MLDVRRSKAGTGGAREGDEEEGGGERGAQKAERAPRDWEWDDDDGGAGAAGEGS